MDQCFSSKIPMYIDVQRVLSDLMTAVHEGSSDGLQAADDSVNLSDYDEDEENITPARKVYVHRENIYGAIDGVEPGEWWETRMECSRAGVHRYVWSRFNHILLNWFTKLTTTSIQSNSTSSVNFLAQILFLRFLLWIFCLCPTTVIIELNNAHLMSHLIQIFTMVSTLFIATKLSVYICCDQPSVKSLLKVFINLLVTQINRSVKPQGIICKTWNHTPALVQKS